MNRLTSLVEVKDISVILEFIYGKQTLAPVVFRM